jgi:DNA-binding SARP family transcriptional activator
VSTSVPMRHQARKDHVDYPRGVAPTEMENPAGIKVCLLGPVELGVAGQPVALPRQAQRILLATLAIDANRVVSADSLIENLWQTDDNRRWVKNLHTQIYHLRCRLSQLEPGNGKDRISTQPPGYRLYLRDGERDLDVVNQHVTSARRALKSQDYPGAADLYRRALAIWRGRALGDVSAASFMQAKADQLEELRLTIFEERFEAEMAMGLHNELVGELIGLAAQHPFRGRLCRQLMICHYRSGRQPDALRVYEKTRQMLADELGLDPSAELQKLHGEILTASPELFLPTPPPPDRMSAPDRRPLKSRRREGAPRQLPAAVPCFVGRAAELQTLNTLLDRVGEVPGSATISAITGAPGMGKSALALHWAHRVADHFPDGQLYVNMRGSDTSAVPLSPDGALRRFLASLDVPDAEISPEMETLAAIYRTVMADRRMLIVVDDAKDSAQIRWVLPANSGSLLLATSRSQLTGLIVHEGAMPIPVRPLIPDDAHDMLARRLSPSRLAAEPDAVSELLELCAGRPMALAVAAARSASCESGSLAELVRELRDSGGTFDSVHLSG